MKRLKSGPGMNDSGDAGNTLQLKYNRESIQSYEMNKNITYKWCNHGMTY